VVEGEVVKGKAHRNKEEHFYLARRKDVEFIGEKK
jgi:hypothetical protein